MADSKAQRIAEEWVRETWLLERFNQPFQKRRLTLSSGGEFEFDAVSRDEGIVASISTNGGITAAGREAKPKLNKIRSDILFLILSSTNQRFVLLTDKAMFKLCEQERANGRMPPQIEFIYVPLPSALEEQCRIARLVAAQEQGHKKSAY